MTKLYWEWLNDLTCVGFRLTAAEWSQRSISQTDRFTLEHECSYFNKKLQTSEKDRAGPVKSLRFLSLTLSQRIKGGGWGDPKHLWMDLTRGLVPGMRRKRRDATTPCSQPDGLHYITCHSCTVIYDTCEPRRRTDCLIKDAFKRRLCVWMCAWERVSVCVLRHPFP